MKAVVYAIENEVGSKYIGSTTDLVKRLKRHNLVGTKYTRKFKDWKVISFVEFESIEFARKYEKLIKRNHAERQKFYMQLVNESGSSSIG